MKLVESNHQTDWMGIFTCLGLDYRSGCGDIWEITLRDVYILWSGLGDKWFVFECPTCKNQTMVTGIPKNLIKFIRKTKHDSCKI